MAFDTAAVVLFSIVQIVVALMLITFGLTVYYSVLLKSEPGIATIRTGILRQKGWDSHWGRAANLGALPAGFGLLILDVVDLLFFNHPLSTSGFPFNVAQDLNMLGLLGLLTWLGLVIFTPHWAMARWYRQALEARDVQADDLKPTQDNP